MEDVARRLLGPLPPRAGRHDRAVAGLLRAGARVREAAEAVRTWPSSAPRLRLPSRGRTTGADFSAAGRSPGPLAFGPEALRWLGNCMSQPPFRGRTMSLTRG